MALSRINSRNNESQLLKFQHDEQKIQYLSKVCCKIINHTFIRVADLLIQSVFNYNGKTWTLIVRTQKRTKAHVSIYSVYYILELLSAFRIIIKVGIVRNPLEKCLLFFANVRLVNQFVRMHA